MTSTVNFFARLCSDWRGRSAIVRNPAAPSPCHRAVQQAVLISTRGFDPVGSDRIKNSVTTHPRDFFLSMHDLPSESPHALLFHPQCPHRLLTLTVILTMSLITTCQVCFFMPFVLFNNSWFISSSAEVIASGANPARMEALGSAESADSVAAVHTHPGLIGCCPVGGRGLASGLVVWLGGEGSWPGLFRAED